MLKASFNNKELQTVNVSFSPPLSPDDRIKNPKSFVITRYQILSKDSFRKITITNKSIVIDSYPELNRVVFNFGRVFIQPIFDISDQEIFILLANYSICKIIGSRVYFVQKIPNITAIKHDNGIDRYYLGFTDGNISAYSGNDLVFTTSEKESFFKKLFSGKPPQECPIITLERNDRYLYSIDLRNVIRIFDVVTGRIVVERHFEALLNTQIESAYFAFNGERIILVVNQSSIIIFEVMNPSSELIQFSNSKINNLTIHEDQVHIITNRNKYIRYDANFKELGCIEFSLDSSVYLDKEILFQDINDEIFIQYPTVLNNHLNTIFSVVNIILGDINSKELDNQIYNLYNGSSMIQIALELIESVKSRQFELDEDDFEVFMKYLEIPHIQHFNRIPSNSIIQRKIVTNYISNLFSNCLGAFILFELEKSNPNYYLFGKYWLRLQELSQDIISLNYLLKENLIDSIQLIQDSYISNLYMMLSDYTTISNLPPEHILHYSSLFIKPPVGILLARAQAYLRLEDYSGFLQTIRKYPSGIALPQLFMSYCVSMLMTQNMSHVLIQFLKEFPELQNQTLLLSLLEAHEFDYAFNMIIQNTQSKEFHINLSKLVSAMYAAKALDKFVHYPFGKNIGEVLSVLENGNKEAICVAYVLYRRLGDNDKAKTCISNLNINVDDIFSQIKDFNEIDAN